MQNSQLDELPELIELYSAFAFETPITATGGSGMLLVPFAEPSGSKAGAPEHFIPAYAPGRLAAWETLHGIGDFIQLTTWTQLTDRRGATVWKALVTAARAGDWDAYEVPHEVNPDLFLGQIDQDALTCPVFPRLPIRELDITTWKPACGEGDCASRPEMGVVWHGRYRPIGILCAPHAAQAAMAEKGKVEPLDNYTLEQRCEISWRSHSCDLPYQHPGPHVCRSDCGFDQADEDDEAWSNTPCSYILTRWANPVQEQRSAESVIARMWDL